MVIPSSAGACDAGHQMIPPVRALGDEYVAVRHRDGRREMTSDQPFSVTVWGWGTAATGGDLIDPSVPGFYSQFCSYAYPAGASVQSISDVVVPPVPE